MKIVCFHLYNDFSGSPKVLDEVLSALRERDMEIELITSRGGVLDGLEEKGVKSRYYRYTFSPRPLVTMMRYSWVQLRTFLMALGYARREDTVFYINTILPSGPALAGRLTGKKVVYHYHENAFIKSRFYRILAGMMERLADRIVCVSAYQASFLARKDKVRVVPNVPGREFLSRLRPDPEAAFGRKSVLMLSSLKGYKGTAEFIRLAASLPQFKFVLVVNDTRENIDRWLQANGLDVPGNLTVHPRSADVSRFYNEASIVVNLSKPSQFIETFGLTAIEAMNCGLPVIVPEVGGIAEMVEDGVNGYRIDCSDTDRLRRAVSSMLTDRQLYLRLADGASAYAGKFDREKIYDYLKAILLEDK